MGIILERLRNLSGIESCLWKWISISIRERENEMGETRRKKWLQINYFMVELLKQLFCWPWPGSSFRSRPTDRRILIHIARMIHQISIHHKFYNLLLCGNSAQAQNLDLWSRTGTSHITDFLSFFRPSRGWRWVISVLCLCHYDAIIN